MIPFQSYFADFYASLSFFIARYFLNANKYHQDKFLHFKTKSGLLSGDWAIPLQWTI